MDKKLLLETSHIEKLYKEHYTFLCLVSFSILKDRDSANDVVQDFFISFWQKRQDVSVKISFQAYAAKAVKNLSLMALKNAHKKEALDLNLNKHEENGDDLIEVAKKHAKTWDLLNQLPQSRRDIFISYVVYSYSYAEIAELNGISINTVKTQMKRSYAFLRSQARASDLVCLFAIIFLF